MTSISSSTAASLTNRPSPRDRLKTELASEVASGTISSTDQQALSSAIDSIDKTLSAERSAGTSSGKPPSRDEMQQKIADLINKQVEAGTLTADQAGDLQSVFSNALDKKGGPEGAGGVPPGPPPSGDAGSDDESTTTSTSSDDDAIGKLLKALQEAIASRSNYGAEGTTTASSTATTGKVLDLVA